MQCMMSCQLQSRKRRNKQLRFCDEKEMNFKNLLPAKNRDELR